MKLSSFNINPIWDEKSKLYNNTLSKEEIDKILYSNMNDTNIKCEYGILLGISRKIEAVARAEMAAKLYSEGRIKKILITGGKNGISSKSRNQTPININLDNKDISEIYVDEYSANIPEEDIILDEESNNTIENMQYAKKIFNLNEGDNVIIITSGYHMRRAIGTALKHLSNKINYCPIIPNTGYFEKDNYYKTKLGMQLAAFDANRCIEQSRKDIIEDIDI